MKPLNQPRFMTRPAYASVAYTFASADGSGSKKNTTMKTNFCNTPVALANDNYDVRGKAGTFSAETEDAVDAAHKASAAAHKAGTKDGHERAARMHRLAAKRHTDAGDTENAELHEGIASGHDSMAATCHAPTPALANEFLIATRSGENYRLALDNETEIDADGWALVAPYGEHPKTRFYRENGQIREQKFIQVLDNEAADSMMAKENSFFRTLKRALIGIPVYKGHGDLNDADPKAVANEKQKIKLGVVDQIRKGARGIEAHFALDNDGAEAVAAGWKFPSAFWWVLPNGKRDDAILAKPFKLISVALTPFPNISGVESLANARSQIEREQKQTKEPDMKLIAGWLIAQGVALANAENPTETQVLEAMKTVLTSKAGEVTALGNEKSTLTGKITGLEGEKATLTTRATTAETALENERTQNAAARKALAGVVVDEAIRLGIKTVADRDSAITSLANSADFAKDADALLKTKPVHKTDRSGLDMSGKQQAALSNEAQALQNEYNAAFQTELQATGQNPVQAHRNIMTLPKYTGLAAKLVPAKTATAH